MPRRRLTREESRERTRARIIDAAAKVIARRGFHGASVDEIAQEAGYTKGAVYSNFDSKEDLFLTLLEERMESRLEEVREAFARVDTFEDIRGEAQAFAKIIDQERELWLLALEFWAHAARDHQVRRRIARLYDGWRGALAELIAAQAERVGLPVPADPRLVAAAAIAITEGFALQRLMDPKAVDDESHGQMQAWLFAGVAASTFGLDRPEQLRSLVDGVETSR